MAGLTIPARYRIGLAKLGSLSDESFEKLHEAIEKCPPAVTAKDISSYAASVAPDIPASDVENIVKSVCSIYVIRLDYGIPAQRVASDVTEAMTSGTEGKDASLDAHRFEDRLKRLLEVESLSYVAKAKSLRGDFSCLFYDAKVITDLRPVFGKPEERPLGAIITHVLKLEYHEHGEHKELYIALDLGDIASLKAVLERAEVKNTSLSSFLRSSGLPATETES